MSMVKEKTKKPGEIFIEEFISGKHDEFILNIFTQVEGYLKNNFKKEIGRDIDPDELRHEFLTILFLVNAINVRNYMYHSFWDKKIPKKKLFQSISDMFAFVKKKGCEDEITDYLEFRIRSYPSFRNVLKLNFNESHFYWY